MQHFDFVVLATEKSVGFYQFITIGPEEMGKVAQIIAKVLNHIGEETVYQQARDEVAELNRRFPTPGITA